MTKAKSGRSSRSKPVSKTSKGNIFEFYVPKIPGTRPRPKLVKDKKDPKKLVYDKTKPADFLKTSFTKTTSVNFGKGPNKNLLTRYPALPLPQIVRAALECGYGRRKMWSSHLLLSSTESKELSAYLIKRLLMAVSCIRVDKNDAYVTCDFYSKIEPSEKVAISFIAGGIGSFIAAKYWLDAAGEKVKVMLHTSIYTKGISSSIKTNLLTSKKSPDYLVESDSGKWHVFESKGGTDRGRNKRIQEGLLQLGLITHLGWSSDPKQPQSVITQLCTHTSIDAGSRLKVVAYDPPGENDEGFQEIIIDEAVCKLLKIAESLDQFHAINTETYTEEKWEWKSVSQTENLEIALPSKYFNLEVRLRASLGLFLLVNEIIEKYKERTQWSAKFMIERLENNINSYHFDGEYKTISDAFIVFIKNLNDAEEEDVFIVQSRQYLDLDRVLREFDAVLQESQLSSTFSQPNDIQDEGTNVMMSSGMLIRETVRKA